MALPIGTRLGPYEILSVIPAFSMGEVYRARDARLDGAPLPLRKAIDDLADGAAVADRDFRLAAVRPQAIAVNRRII